LADWRERREAVLQVSKTTEGASRQKIKTTRIAAAGVGKKESQKKLNLKRRGTP